MVQSANKSTVGLQTDDGKESDLIKKLNEKIRFLEENLRTQIDQTLKIQEEAKIKNGIIEELQREKLEITEGMETPQIINKLQKLENLITETKNILSSGGIDNEKPRTTTEHKLSHSAILLRSIKSSSPLNEITGNSD